MESRVSSPDLFRECRMVPLSERHVQEVASIERESFGRPLSRDSLLCYLSRDDSAFLAAISASGRVLGYGGFVQEGYWGHILTMATHPEFRRRGVARLVLQALLRTLSDRHLIGALLEVRSSNGRARRLYESLGFVQGRIRPRFYEENEDAVVMVWRHLGLSPSHLNEMKSDHRKRMRVRRKSLSGRERQEKDHLIGSTLVSLPVFKRSETLLFYIALPDEASTSEAMRIAIQAGKRICAPRVDRSLGCIIPHEIPGEDALIPGAFGIREPDPSQHKPVPLEEIGLVIVPGMSFDYAGGRLGWGMGYYDRFLSTASQAYPVGLAFESQMCELVPMGSHDVILKSVITEQGTYGG